MKRFTPLFIVLIFGLGVTWMIVGMNNVLKMTDPAQAKIEKSK